MTRKCVLCKATNYRNNYSFFSAPKDLEMRKKWQDAIAIENYVVTDETYVCSKHFHKNDIITHWVSGVPPHVITIKYKKCRLRPGAVPGRQYNLEENSKMDQDQRSNDSDLNMGDYITFKDDEEEEEEEEEKKESFLIPRTKEDSRIGSNENSGNVNVDYKFSQALLIDDDFEYEQTSKKALGKMELSKEGLSSNNMSLEESKTKDQSEKSQKQFNKIVYTKNNGVSTETINSEDGRKDQKQIHKESSRKVLESSSKNRNTFDGDDSSVEMWKEKSSENSNYPNEESVDKNYKTMEDLYIENQVLNTLNYDHLDAYYTTYNDTDESEMLFEDLLEVCTEVLLPRGWSCLVTSKGHTTTIVYLYMGMTKSGLPFTEKQVFVKSDMILRCSAVNIEINPLMHNLIREGKHLKVQNLLDVEELIDEFDQRVVCQGIFNTEGFEEINGGKAAYKDGIKWRHVLCPLIVNNDSTRCTKCFTLSDSLLHKSKKFPPFRYNSLVFVKNDREEYPHRQTRKRTRKHDRRYEFIKVFKK